MKFINKIKFKNYSDPTSTLDIKGTTKWFAEDEEAKMPKRHTLSPVRAASSFIHEDLKAFMKGERDGINPSTARFLQALSEIIGEDIDINDPDTKKKLLPVVSSKVNIPNVKAYINSIARNLRHAMSLLSKKRNTDENRKAIDEIVASIGFSNSEKRYLIGFKEEHKTLLFAFLPDSRRYATISDVEAWENARKEASSMLKGIVSEEATLYAKEEDGKVVVTTDEGDVELKTYTMQNVSSKEDLFKIIKENSSGDKIKYKYLVYDKASKKRSYKEEETTIGKALQEVKNYLKTGKGDAKKIRAQMNSALNALKNKADLLKKLINTSAQLYKAASGNMTFVNVDWESPKTGEKGTTTMLGYPFDEESKAETEKRNEIKQRLVKIIRGAISEARNKKKAPHLSVRGPITKEVLKDLKSVMKKYAKELAKYQASVHNEAIENIQAEVSKDEETLNYLRSNPLALTSFVFSELKDKRNWTNVDKLFK